MTDFEFTEKQYTIKEAHEKTRIPLSSLTKACKAAVSEPKSIEDVSAIILTLVNDAYDKGYKAGKADAKAAIKEALKG